MRYISIGDVHGQHRALQQAIMELDDGNTFFILLGDLNDARLKNEVAQASSSSVQCLYLAMNLMSRGVGVTLQSNHGTYLYRALLGGELPYSTIGLSHTLREMDTLLYEERIRIGRWLQGLPYYWDVVIPSEAPYCSTSGQWVTSWHWYATHGMWVPYMDKYRPTKEHVEASVYGRGPNGKRYKFWECKEYISSLPVGTRTISGHYHKVILQDPCFVIDDNCGSGGPLMALCLNDLRQYRFSN
jgi:hypothetical protein